MLDIKTKLTSKIRSDQQALEKLNAGKTTLKTLFKGQGGKQIEIVNLNNSITQAKRDCDLYQKIINTLDIYLAETSIQEFKDEKVEVYYRMIKQFCSFEINNSHVSAHFWSNILGNTNLKHF